MKIKSTIANVSLNMGEIVDQELPNVSLFYSNGQGDLKQDAKELFEYMIKNNGRLPIYSIDQASVDSIMGTAGAAYAAMGHALDIMFSMNDDDIKQWYPCEASRHPAFDGFLLMAKHTWTERHPTVYGRFDLAINPNLGTVKGIYEFNGDTPVMLFESVNLQNMISEKMDRPDDQANRWWLDTAGRRQEFTGKKVAIVCDPGFIEDTVSCDTLAQALTEAGAVTYFTDIQSFNHDVLSLRKPFFVEGVDAPVDMAFMLLPWEEMIIGEKSQEILVHWEQWVDQVKFLEPAWRWFMSHKGFMAWMTWLIQNDEEFRDKWGDLPFLETYLVDDQNSYEQVARLEQSGNYVLKPVTGRLSNNIQVFEQGQQQTDTGGHYSDEPMVIQALCRPGRIDGANFIAGVWLADTEPASLCFREFDSPVLSIANERFKAHVIDG
ncbi:putative glutathionylspermidine synthase [Delftia phage PhiW-14]|uniref:Putative glutathionylspermidine synthase n=1 Tax=Delftia phage PhiW-14 TaxID=665032 RepID=C9DG62_BPW14|nr:glutathionylspermidine synthase [Delftia phage PhiW-14]ACV50113.1 putative glutathionylspermidine synthase [Delftia phage PhiW-14]